MERTKLRIKILKCVQDFFFDEYLLKHCHGLGNISEPLVFNLVKLDIMECQ